MGRLNIATTVKGIILSRFFLVSAVVWIIFTFLAAVAAVGVVSDSSTINSYSIPDSQVSAIIQLNNSTITYFGQDFNSYGSGIPATSAYYNLTGGSKVTGSVMQHISSGYAGRTNSTGFLAFNISHVNPGYDFFLSMHYYNSENGINSTQSYFISGNSHDSAAGGISITPVRSYSNRSTFALHVFTTPGIHYSSAEVYFQKEPDFFLANAGPTYFNYGRTVGIGSANISGAVNIQTPIMLQGRPYFYGAGINESGGGLIGSSFFSTLPTPANEAYEASGFVFSLSSLMGIPCAFTAILLLGTTYTATTRKPWRLIPEVLQDDTSETRSAVFIKREVAALLASMPFVAITSIMAEIVSVSAYGVMIPAAEVLIISAGMLLTLLMGSSYAAILLGTGSLRDVPRGSPGHSRNQWRSLALMAPLVAGVFIMVFRNFQMSPIYVINPVSVVQTTFLDPFGYVLLILQKVTGSLLSGGPYTFAPSDYGISYASIFVAGVAWAILWTVVPYFLFRRFPRRNSIPGKSG